VLLELERSSASAVLCNKHGAVLSAAALLGEAEHLVLCGNASWAMHATYANGPWRTR
jgi:hypothetical protein